MNTADYLIVGQGVAGSVLAWTLEQRGCKVLVVDAPERPSAAKVAAGIVNPLTGRKLVHTWKANELFPFLHQYYRQIENQLSVQFFHPLSIYRPFRSLDEKSTYLGLLKDPNVAEYAHESIDNQHYNDYIYNDYGGLNVTGGGWVDLPEFINIVKGYFIKKGQFLEGLIKPEDLEIKEDSVIIADFQVKKVIFCDGVDARENSLFSWLPYNPVKGQVLTAVVEDYPIEQVVNQGVFILPLRAGLIKIGATYSWHDLDWQTTTDGREFLENKVRNILKVPYTVVDQKAGIRPSTKDRRPFIGLHPAHPSVGIFGGLGTKGVSLAPFLANQFADFLLEGKEIDPETNISRCLSLYYRIRS